MRPKWVFIGIFMPSVDPLTQSHIAKLCVYVQEDVYKTIQ